MRLFLAHLLAVIRRRRLDRELPDEISAHLEFATADNVARGMSQEEARRTALRRFGGVLQTEEAYRDRQGFPLLESLWQDVRYATRSMRRSLAFAAVAILTLALGIGATAAIFNLVYASLLRPLPFPEADRIVAVYATNLKENASRDSTSFPDFSDWQSQSHAFTGVAAYRSDRFNITGDGAPEPLAELRASHELFSVLRVTPFIGRAFDKQEQHGKSAVALISHGLWTRRYGRDPQILNRTILLNEVSHASLACSRQASSSRRSCRQT